MKLILLQHYSCLLTYFICGLFKDDVSSLTSVVSNDKIISK